MMRSSFRAAALAAAFLVCVLGPALVPGGTVEGAAKKAKKANVPLSQEGVDSLPDWENDAKMKKELKCNACAVSTSEMVDALIKGKAKKYRKLTYDESVDVVEATCTRMKTTYGLQLRNNSNDDSISKAEGNWITSLLMNQCGAVLGDYDDFIIKKHKEMPRHELLAAVCQAGTRTPFLGDPRATAPFNNRLRIAERTPDDTTLKTSSYAANKLSLA